ncbi:MAG: cbb3-type cytochrome c oxidase subunit 3 [Rhodobacteraceae bacterium]|nr:cbb3-type cytochrome c oxidase subunit 3 [Paracoccaceae bacterium]
METYSLLRQFADSWMLLLLTAVFVGVIVWAWRPGSRRLHDDTARMIFRNDDRPATGATGTPRTGAAREEACK